MDEHVAQRRSEAMLINLTTDKTAKEASYGATVSRESSFSSVELAASNPVSRESSFSSAASSSGSGIFEADSPRSPSSRSNSWRSNEDPSERQLISSVTDQQYQRLHNARARFRKVRQAPSSGSSSTEAFHTPPESTRPMTNLKRPEVHGRSASEPEVLVTIANRSKLSSSPSGLVISTPPVKGFIEYRLRSRSFTGEEDREENRILHDFSRSHLQVPDSGIEAIKRSVPKSRQGDVQGNLDKNLKTPTFSEKEYEMLKKERDDLRKERDNLRHECDRLQCERDAMQLERDTLLREKEELQAELNNRNDIIHHLQDHVKMSVRSLVVKEDAKSPSMKQRSKSEVRRPAFYFPDEIAKTNAYTCL